MSNRIAYIFTGIALLLVSACENAPMGTDAATDSGAMLDSGVMDAAEGGCVGNDDCAVFEFCAIPDRACSGVGECVARAGDCGPGLPEQCGCDGMTYQDACERAAAGVSLASEGRCP